MSDFLIDEFNVLSILSEDVVKIRVFPYGTVFKNGRKIEITPEMAGKFRLPHYMPPLKLGSHDDSSPSGGSFIGVEAGVDGLYGLVSLTEKGKKVLADKDYRYHSPEVIWEGGALENPTTGELINGPLLVGVALLHNPHLGNDAALYHVEEQKFVEDKMENTEKTFPITFQQLKELFWRKDEVMDEVKAEPSPDINEFAAKIKEREEQIELLQTQIAEIEYANVRKGRVAHFAQELVNEGDEVHNLLADLDEEVAEKLVSRFKALYAQAKQEVDVAAGVPGNTEQNVTPAEALNATVLKFAAENKVSYPAALNAILAERPDLAKQYYEMEGGD